MWFRLVWLTVLLMAMPIGAFSEERRWWASTGDDSTEAGRIDEIKDKTKIYVTVNYQSDNEQVNVAQEREMLRRSVLQSLSAYKGLEVVDFPENADLAISVTAATTGAQNPGAGNFSAALDPEVQTPLEVLVLVRGARLPDGDYRARVVWELSSPNVRGEAGPAARFAIDGFLEQLKKLRGEKKK